MRGDLADHKRGDAIGPPFQQGVGRLLLQCESKSCIRQGSCSESARRRAGAGVIRVGPLSQAAEFGHTEGEFHRGRGWYVRRFRVGGLEHATREDSTRRRVSERGVGKGGESAPHEGRSGGERLSSVGRRSYDGLRRGGEVHRSGKEHRP